MLLEHMCMVLFLDLDVDFSKVITSRVYMTNIVCIVQSGGPAKSNLGNMRWLKRSRTQPWCT